MSFLAFAIIFIIVALVGGSMLVVGAACNRTALSVIGGFMVGVVMTLLLMGHENVTRGDAIEEYPLASYEVNENSFVERYFVTYIDAEGYSHERYLSADKVHISHAPDWKLARLMEQTSWTLSVGDKELATFVGSPAAIDGEREVWVIQAD